MLQMDVGLLRIYLYIYIHLLPCTSEPLAPSYERGSSCPELSPVWHCYLMWTLTRLKYLLLRTEFNTLMATVAHHFD